MSSTIPVFDLSNGLTIPGIGVGCWLGQPGGDDAVREMVEYALKVRECSSLLEELANLTRIIYRLAIVTLTP